MPPNESRAGLIGVRVRWAAEWGGGTKVLESH